MNRTAITPVLIALLVVAGMTAPAAAFAATASPHPAPENAGPLPAKAAQADDTQNESNVSVAVGQQLATVISVSSDEVRTEYGNTAFELSVEGADDESAAGAVADRADELRERAEAIREDYEAATEAYEAGELTKSEYAQRLASLNARASNLNASYEQLSQRAERVSSLELRAAGANLSSLDASLENLSSVTGAGSSALLEQYLGEADGEIELETTGGLKIEIEREDGESSREFERARDDDMNITVAHSDALATARDALSTPEEGRWALAESKVKALEGAYEFEFALAEAATLTGEAKVRVDGSTGEIYRLEQETERRGDDDEREREDDDEHDELTLLVVEGAPEPGATVTLQVLADGEPAGDATVEVNDHEVGTTDEHGTLVVTLPDAARAEIAAEAGDAEGELEFEFDAEHETDHVYQRLHVAASLDGDDVTVEVRFDGEPVRNATVYANDHRVGTTGAHGAVTFAIDASASEELELEVVKGAFEAELTYELHDGSLVLTEAEHEGDGDKAEREVDEDDGDEHAHDGEHEDDADDDDRDDADDGDRSLAMSVIDGTAEPGATVTVAVRADGAPVEGATVTVNGELAGTTDADGTIEIVLPMEDSIDLRAEHGDADTRLEFDFEFDESDEPETETEEA